MRESCQLALEPGKQGLVWGQDKRPVGHDQDTRGAQTEVAGEFFHNPAESQTEGMEQGRREQEAQHVAAGSAGRGLGSVGLAVQRPEPTNDQHRGGRRPPDGSHDKATEHKDPGDHPRLRERQFDARESGSCPNRHHVHEGRQLIKSGARPASGEERRPDAGPDHGQQMIGAGEGRPEP